MGISNFTLLLKSIKSCSPLPFDSILIDAQSLLYVAINYTIKETETEILSDVCEIVLSEIGSILNDLFQTKLYQDSVSIVVSFDGSAPPMKWPTQYKRREIPPKGKNLYRVVLFGNNIISQKVYHYIYTCLLNFSKFKAKYLKYLDIPNRLKFFLSGSNIADEGEHKIIHIAKKINCKKPIFVSEDNDIFILSYKHFLEFEHIQIKRKQNIYYDLHGKRLMYDQNYLVNASLLLGNDFIPSIISISTNNFNCIHDALFNFSGGELPDLFYFLLNYLIEKDKIRFNPVPFIDIDLIMDFWKTCFWILDYYTYRIFPQKYILNTLFNAFDRNAIISALLDIDYSKEVYEKAKKQYDILISQPQESVTHVFQPDQLNTVKRFLITNTDENARCHIIEIIRKKKD